VVGLWLAGVDDKTALALAAAGASLFGSTFVTLTWALESTRAEEGDLASGKAHLVRFRDAVSHAAALLKIDVSTDQRVLAGWQSFSAFWCSAAILATCMLTIFVLHLLRCSLSFGQQALITVLMASIASVVVIVPIRAAVILTIINSVGFVVLLRFMSVPKTQSVVGTIVVNLPLIVTCSFRNMRFDDLPGVMDKLGRLISTSIAPLYIWFIKER
jgi:magnesium-transporting ATPase (P-type)